MASPDLVVYIRQQTQEGIPAQELRVALMEAGWNERDVDNALHDVAAGLQPVTSGASIHEDLAQVRGMVAHLASRVKVLEARLTGGVVGALPELQQLPSGQAMPLPSPRRVHAVSALLPFLIATTLVVAGWPVIGFTADVALRGLLLAVLLGLLCAFIGIRMMRRHHGWWARLFTAVAGASWALAGWYAWQTMGLMETTTAAALAVFIAVYLLVAGRWIERLVK